jgi:hypothetical protein
MMLTCKQLKIQKTDKIPAGLWFFAFWRPCPVECLPYEMGSIFHWGGAYSSGVSRKQKENYPLRPLPALWNACPMKCLPCENRKATISSGRSIFHWGEAYSSGVESVKHSTRSLTAKRISPGWLTKTIVDAPLTLDLHPNYT